MKAKVGHVFVEYSRGTRGYAALKLREQSYKTVTSHIMAEGPANVGSLFLTRLSAMSMSPVRNCMNSSRVASSPSDLDARKVSWVSTSGKRRFLELNGHRAAVLILRPLEPGVCQLGDFTGYWLLSTSRWAHRVEAHH